MTNPHDCLHYLDVESLGYTSEALIQHAAPAVAGMTVRVSVWSCPRCGSLVAGVTLGPKDSPATLATAAATLGEVHRDGERG